MKENYFLVYPCILSSICYIYIMERKTNISNTKEEKGQAMNTLIKTLGMFTSKEDKKYWLNVMVNEKDLTESEAGRLTLSIDKGLI